MKTAVAGFPVVLLAVLMLTGTPFLPSCDSVETPKGSIFETELASSRQAAEATQKNGIQVPVPGMVSMVDRGPSPSFRAR